MHIRSNWSFIYILLFQVLSVTLSAAEPVKIYHLLENIEFDGLPFEDAWTDAEMFPLVMHRPNYGAEPSEKSEVMIAYDKDFLWVGARLFTKDPSTIKSTSKKRDEQSRNSDAFTIILDTFNDNENAMGFGTMPSGLRIDYTVSSDANMSSGGQMGAPGGGTINLSWNTFWDVKTSRDDKGWYVEMRIPFSSLRFQAQGESVSMGLIVQRSISSRNEVDTYPAIDPKYGMMAPIKPSQAADVSFTGIKSSRPVYVSPYAIGGYGRHYDLNDEETLYLKENEPKIDVGLDVKYSLTSNMTMDVTLNTDFAQVEADDQQVNLTRYSLYFPEKRLFFQERSSIFSYKLGGTSDMFYSRRIGIEEEERTRIFGGVKLIGRAGKWDIGFLDMQTQKLDTIPSNNFGVARLRRQVFNPNSYVGGLVTTKIGADGTYDVAYGLDGLVRVFGDDYVDLKLAQNQNKEVGADAMSMKPTMIRANWERRSDKGFAYNLTYAYFGDHFDPQVGFMKYIGSQGFEGEMRYGWLPGSESKIFSTAAGVRVERMTRTTGGDIETFMVAPGFEVFGKSGLGGMFSLMYKQEGVDEAFDLSDDVGVPVGHYKFYGAEAVVFTPMSKPYNAMIMINGGEYYDGKNFSIMIMPTMSISQSLQVKGSYQFNYVNFPGRDKFFRSHVANVSMLYMFNIKLSTSLLVQYNSFTGDFVGNFRLRFNPKEGNDFYLVIDENEYIGNVHPDPDPPVFYNRAVMVKYTHTFRL
ncbi:MAG: carbohydrate binding family 9 domain-containing protein [Bacteroidales bacterium]|nr:carbohydrate binding family 9 domain-containing protein [Bacteroidales bacterium]